jgi:membrane fusion protein (multidrug efflux system)
MTSPLFRYLRHIIPVIAVSLLIPASCGKRHGSDDGKPVDRRSMMSVPLEGFLITSSVINRSITISGTVRPFEETVLMPEVTGRVVAINLPEGNMVKQGTLLVKLFDGDLQAQLKKAKAQLEIAQQTKERLAELLKISGVSRSDFDQATLQVNALSADIDIIGVQIRKTEVIAPYDGAVGLRNISPGAQVTPQTPLATIRSVNKLKVDFSVPEKYAHEVIPGMKLSFSIEGADKAYTATVMATEQGIDAATRNLKVRALVNAADAALTSGAFARITLDLGTDSSAIMIPTQAIIPQERDKKVIVVRSGKALFVKVSTGERRESTVEVTGGLASGDTIVTTGLLFLRPGMPVKLSRLVQ